MCFSHIFGLRFQCAIDFCPGSKLLHEDAVDRRELVGLGYSVVWEKIGLGLNCVSEVFSLK